MTKKTIRIALLLCDVPLDPVKEEFGDYRDIFERWLLGALATYPDVVLQETFDLVVDGFNVVGKGELPSIEQLKTGPSGYDVVMLTGSRHTAHELEPPFVPILIDFIRLISNHIDLEQLKIIGICFGHQLISLALGGISERGTKGWEIGVYGARMTEEGRKIFLAPGSATDHPSKIYIEQMLKHRDHVPEPPKGFIVCLKTDKYPVQSMIKYHTIEGQSAPTPHIFTIQGHPEFTPEIVHAMVEYRVEYGILDEATGIEARRRVWGKNRQGGEGLGRVGWAVWNVILGLPSNA